MLTPGDAGHPDHAVFDKMLRTVQRDGRWNEGQSHNIAASLLQEYKADALCKTLDSVRIGGSADAPRVFAVSSPHGEKARISMSTSKRSMPHSARCPRASLRSSSSISNRRWPRKQNSRTKPSAARG
ncbi:hypothetical protein PUV44_23690 [Xanthomonas arboricola pv. corylina]|nr:hypothetical protein PUV44_23690 [Xanthomonas arboricola pv. corylina]